MIESFFSETTGLVAFLLNYSGQLYLKIKVTGNRYISKTNICLDLQLNNTMSHQVAKNKISGKNLVKQED